MGSWSTSLDFQKDAVWFEFACHFSMFSFSIALSADPESFVRGGQTQSMFFCFFFCFFFVFFCCFFWGRTNIEIPLKAGQYRSASETPFKWRLAGGPMMAQYNTLNAGLKPLWFVRESRPVLLRNSILSSFSRGGGGGVSPVLPSGSAHEHLSK